MNRTLVRRFQPDDAERVRDLNERAMAETPEYVPDAPDADLRDVQGHYLDGDGEFLVSTCEGTVVATGAFVPLEGWMAERFPDDQTAELTRMRVAPTHRREGHGSRLLDALETRARREGYERLVLNTGAENRRAREFYESRGFEGAGEVTVTFGGVTLDLALYRQRLRR